LFIDLSCLTLPLSLLSLPHYVPTSALSTTFPISTWETDEGTVGMKEAQLK